MYFILWVALAIAVGAISLSQNKGFGFGFFLSLILSPLIGIIIVLLTNSDKKHCKFCKCQLLPNQIFCEACGKNKEGHTKEDFTNGIVDVTEKTDNTVFWIFIVAFVIIIIYYIV